MANVSIKDLAQAAGVSFSTVSRALNDNPAISQEVRARVQALAKTMGYTPNALAQGLQGRLTHSIGLVITTISDPFFVDVAQGVEEVAREEGFSVFLATSNNDPDEEIKVIETFSRRRVDGVIVAASLISAAYTARLEQIRIPVVMINNQAEGDYHNLYSISMDDYAGGCMAVEHLLDLGHRRIGYIGAGNRPSSNARRLESYRAGLTSHGIEPRDSWVRIGQAAAAADLASDLTSGKALAAELLAEGEVTALFCYCDTIAAGALLACTEAGVAVPDQISLMGFDDNNLCEIVSPPITTVRQPKREMGQLAVRMLRAIAVGEQVDDRVLQPTLKVRASTRQLQA